MSDWSIQVASSGSFVDLETAFGFKVEQMIGVGMAPLDTISSEFGLLDGAIFQRQRTEVRQFSLVGTLKGSSIQNLHSKRKGLIDAVKPDRSASQQPVVLRYSGASNAVSGSCYFAGGLELGNVSARIERQIGLRFVQLDPYWAGTTSSSTALTTRTTVSNANCIIQRNSSGTWAALGTGMDATVQALVVSPASPTTLFVGGNFTTAGGTTACRIAKWNGSAWSNLTGTGANAEITTLAVAPNGNLYVGGDFTSIGGTSINRAASWSGAAYTTLGTGGMNDAVLSMVFSTDGRLYAGGLFTTAGGVTVNYVAGYTGTTWAALDGGMDANVNGLARGRSASIIYAGGDFTDAGGVTASKIAKWNGSTWAAMASGMNNTVNSIVVAEDETVYALGEFTTAGGVSACRVSAWNGGGWKAMGEGFDTGGDELNAASGQLYAGGTFLNSGSITFTDGIARWNGSIWFPVGVDLPGVSRNVLAVHTGTDGALTIGYDTTGTASTAAITAVTNSGTANAYPIFTASGPGRIYELINFTTGEMIYFDLVLNSGEVVTLDLRPGKKTFTSNFRGNVINAIHPGSNITTFHLQPGSNNVSLFISGCTTAASAIMSWTPRYWGVDN